MLMVIYFYCYYYRLYIYYFVLHYDSMNSQVLHMVEPNLSSLTQNQNGFVKWFTVLKWLKRHIPHE